MALQYVIKPFTMNLGSGLTRQMPGAQVDDSVVTAAQARAAGGEVWPVSDVFVAAAAAIAVAQRAAKASNEADLEAVMRAGINASVQASLGGVQTASFPGAVLPAKAVTLCLQDAGGAPLNLTAFTYPFPRRGVNVILGAGTGCTVTAKYTTVDGLAHTWTHAFASGGATSPIGGTAVAIESIQSITSDIDPGGTTDVKTSDAYGIGTPFVGVPLHGMDGVVAAPTAYDGPSGGILPATAPNGTHAYSVRYASPHVAGESA